MIQELDDDINTLEGGGQRTFAGRLSWMEDVKFYLRKIL